MQVHTIRRYLDKQGFAEWALGDKGTRNLRVLAGVLMKWWETEASLFGENSEIKRGLKY